MVTRAFDPFKASLIGRAMPSAHPRSCRWHPTRPASSLVALQAGCRRGARRRAACSVAAAIRAMQSPLSAQVRRGSLSAMLLRQRERAMPGRRANVAVGHTWVRLPQSPGRSSASAPGAAQRRRAATPGRRGESPGPCRGVREARWLSAGTPGRLGRIPLCKNAIRSDTGSRGFGRGGGRDAAGSGAILLRGAAHLEAVRLTVRGRPVRRDACKCAEDGRLPAPVPEAAEEP
jgi:hypothetical protein